MFETGTSHEHGFEFEPEVGWPVAPANARARIQLGGVSPDELDDEVDDDSPTTAGVPADARPQPKVAATAGHRPEPPAQTDTGGGRDRPPVSPSDRPVPIPEEPEPGGRAGGDAGTEATDAPTTLPVAVEITTRQDGRTMAINHGHDNAELLARAAVAVETGEVASWPQAGVIHDPSPEDPERTYHVDNPEEPTMFTKRTVLKDEEEMVQWDSRSEMEAASAIQAVVASDDVQQMVREFGFTKLTYAPPLASSTEVTDEGKLVQTTMYPYREGHPPGIQAGRVVDTVEQTAAGMIAWRLHDALASGGVEASNLTDTQFTVCDTPDGPELVLTDAESYRRVPEGDEYATFESGEVRSFAHTATAEPAVVVPDPYFITEVSPGTTMLGRRGAEEGPVLVAQEDDYAQIVAVYDQVTGEGALLHIRLEDFDEGTYHEPVARVMRELPGLFRTPGVAAYSFGRVGRSDVAELTGELMGGVEQALWRRHIAPVPDGQLQEGDTVRFDLQDGYIHVIDRRGTIVRQLQLPEPWRRN
ncbi:MAG TPA: hypothetical protein VLF40_04000 [Candidatus Saccharimonadales bacterium]|nr:hypothetical protein [Candidatus Saccharimonadales bacterium]